MINKMDGYKAIHDQWYPLYHLAPPMGWLNDPNGLSQMDGIYHFYFQYSPDNPKGGLKHWGHYESTDLINWTYTGAVLSPDCKFDKDGAYSGSALVENGKLYLYYTGNVKEEGDHDYVISGRGANTILVESTDGHLMGKKQCLMTNEDYPKDVTCHVRDPKVWKEDGMYYMVQGARTKEDQGIVLLFESSDRVHWRCQNRFELKESFGFMWECPDLFLLDHVRILSVSPQGLAKEEYRFQNQYQSGYFMIEGDWKAKKDYQLLSFREWDMGFDFYAPQTFMDESGRRLLVGWAGMIDCEKEYDNHLTVEQGWQHMFTMPRELLLKNNIIYQMPAKEMRQLRREEEQIEGNEFNCSTASEILLEQIEASHMELELGNGLSLLFDITLKTFTMKFKDDTGSGRGIRKVRLEKLETLNIFLDRSIIEVYINGGLYVLTSRFYPKTEELKIKLNGIKGVCRKWNMEGFKRRSKNNVKF